MPEENPNLDIPLEEEKISGTDGKSKLSLEEIETEIARRDEERKFEDKKDKDPNTLDPLEIDPKDKPPVEEVIETQPDPRFKDKTVEELQKMYLNVEKLQKTQTDELGTLRKENKNFKDLELKNKSLNLKEIEKKIMPEVLSWTPEERTEWFKLFNNEPEKAIAQVVNKVVEPVVEAAARGRFRHRGGPAWRALHRRDRQDRQDQPERLDHPGRLRRGRSAGLAENARRDRRQRSAARRP